MKMKKGDLIILFKDPKRNYLTTVGDKDFHTDKGFIKLSSLEGLPFGSTVTTNLGENFYILKPSLYDLMMKVNRQTQIIYPKEAAMIIVKAGIVPGSRVIECGAGSASLTTAMASLVRPEGKVYSYERRIEFLENAKKNITKYGLTDWVEFKHREVVEGFDEKDVDFVMIDIGSPWLLIDAAYNALKGGSRLATICPTFEQLTETVFTLEEKGFTNIETLEILTRRILVRRGKTRPEQRIPSHTGFLVFASKIILDKTA